MSKKAKKFDQGKLEWHLLPIEAIEECIRVLMHGKKKYGAWNWTEGFNWSRLSDAIDRHHSKFKSGVDRDDETNLLHMAHIAVTAMFLIVHQLLGLGTDDRFKIKKR